MSFFALALVPGGSVEAAFRAWARLYVWAEPRLESGLPLGAYLGYFSGGKTKGTAKVFLAELEELWEVLPPTLNFDRPLVREGLLYLETREDLSPAVTEARALMGRLGFPPLEAPPLALGPSFFAGKAVTQAPVGSFSCRHLDAALLEVETSAKGLAWTQLARARRLVGPRPRPAGGPKGA